MCHRRAAYNLTSNRLTSTLLLILLTATCLPAEPLLHLADTFQGVPFTRAGRVTVSADGVFLYASNFRSGLTVFRRAAGGEDLEALASYFPRFAGGAIEGVGDFVFSPGEAHVYIPGFTKLLVMSRDSETGLLTLAQTLSSGDPGLPDFSGAAGLVLSPLGDFLYVGLSNPGAQRILVFARDPATGMLSFVQELTSPATTDSPWLSTLLMSPGGEQLFSLGRPAISTFDRDPASGRLTFAGALERLAGEDETLGSTSEGVISPDGSAIYVIGVNGCYNSCRIEAVAVLGRDPLSGVPEMLELAPESIHSSLSTLALSADGRHLYLPDIETDRSRISIFAPRADGRLELQGEFTGQPVRAWGEISALALDTGGRELYASGFEARPLPRLDRDPETGELSFEPPAASAAEGIAGPWDMALSPDGEHLYVTGYLSESIAAFGWDDATGRLEPLAATFSRDSDLPALSYEVSIAMSPDGSRLYAAGFGLMSFARGDAGELELAGSIETHAIGSFVGLEVSPGGSHIYVLGAYGTAVVSRDPASDEMEIVQIFGPDLSYRSLAFSPDGAFGYALVSLDCDQTGCRRALAILERDLTTGMLTQRDTILGPGSMPFESPRAVVVSPDGEQVYVSSIQYGALSVSGFSRNPADGSLAFLDIAFDGEPTDAGYYGHQPLAIAADGRHLYATKVASDALVVFERDPETGRLALLETHGDDLGTAGLAGPVAVAVRPDNQLVYVAGGTGSAVAAFSRRCLPAAGACAGGDRFRIDVAWRDFIGRGGDAGRLEPAGDSSRIFYYLNPDNWEMLVKVLDGCGYNDRWWVFAAATTNLETSLRVTDTWTGQRRTYSNTLGEAAPAITDTAAFATCDVEPAAPAGFAGGSGSSQPHAGSPIKAACGGGPGLCIAERFDLQVEWQTRTGNSGAGHLVPLESPTSGVFYFSNPDNWEMLVKVLDGCAVNDRVWVFAASTTDVETRLTVTDLVTGAQRVYDKPMGVAAPAVTDTNAFAACE